MITYVSYFTHRAVISSIKCALNGLGITIQLFLTFVCPSPIPVSHFLDLYLFPRYTRDSQSRVTLNRCIHSRSYPCHLHPLHLLKWESNDARRGPEMVSTCTIPLFLHAPPPPVSAYPPLCGMKDQVVCKPRGEGLSRRVHHPHCATVSPQTVARRGGGVALGWGGGGMHDWEDTPVPHPSCGIQRNSTPSTHTTLLT